MNHYPHYPLRRTLSLDGAWEFAWLGAEANVAALQPADIHFNERTAVPGVFDVGPRRAGVRGVGLYRTRFRFPHENGRQARLRLGGLGLYARLWFDGRPLDTVRLPYSSLTYDLDLAGDGDEHTLVVAVDNRFDVARTPLFRPDYDFHGYGGIYRSVTIETLPALRVERVHVRTLSVGQARVSLRIRLAGEVPPKADLTLRFDDGMVEAVCARPVDGVVELERTVPDGKPWSPDSPHVHTVAVAVGADAVVERFGIRTVEAKAGRILLNGEPLFLRGVNRHEAHPEFGPVQPAQLISDDIQWLKQMGCNFVRCVHYPQEPAFLDRCDEAGLLVWQESLGWNNTEGEAGRADFRALQLEQTRRMAAEGVNHPSVILWGVLNEGCSDTETGRSLYRALVETLREVDQTRLVSFASNRHDRDLCFDLVDVIAMTLYPGWIGRRRDWYGPSRAEVEPCIREMAALVERPEWRDKPFMIAEIGVCALYGCHDPAAAQWSEEFQAAYLAEVCRVVAACPRVAGLAIWQFCDSRSFVDVGDVRGKPRGFNCAGLLDEYRRPKLACATVKQCFERCQADGGARPNSGTDGRCMNPGDRSEGKGSHYVFHPAANDAEMVVVAGPAHFPGATWYRTTAHDVGVQYRFAAGTLRDYAWLSADLLLDGLDHAVFRIVLSERSSGREFVYRFGLLNQAGARLRLPLAAVDQSRWQTGREGALLKPMCCGDVVDLAAVDRMALLLEAKGDGEARFCMTPLTATVAPPPLLKDLVLPAGPLVDEMGQSRSRSWPGKSADPDEVSRRLRRQLAAAKKVHAPDGWSAWGGWAERTFAKTGFFRTEHDGTRWWLVDPDGHPFWSMGVDCVRSQIPSYLNTIESAYAWLPEPDGPFAAAITGGVPPHDALRFVDFLRVNLIRAFGADWHARWATLALAALRRLGFNTVANWSEWQVAAAARVPYVRPLAPKQGFEELPMVFRDFPDVFDAAFPAACAAYARQLEETRDDPALIGYFLMNEPTWGFADMPPAEGMLRNTAVGPGRAALADWLQARYGGEAGLAAAWGSPVSRACIAAGPWEGALTERACEDLRAFSALMVDKLFGSLSAACRAVDPNHLNLGARYYTIPPAWMAAAMRHFDVFSINGYKDRFPADAMDALYDLVRSPIMVGEWHFGALDAGLPGGCLRRVATQRDRGKAYRVYAEGALAHPACVGVHWFTLYDESPMGRFDGENWNTGFLDVCHRPYAPLATAARRTHERLYAVAAGATRPYAGRVAYRRTNIL